MACSRCGACRAAGGGRGRGGTGGPVPSCRAVCREGPGTGAAGGVGGTAFRRPGEEDFDEVEEFDDAIEAWDERWDAVMFGPGRTVGAIVISHRGCALLREGAGDQRRACGHDVDRRSCGRGRPGPASQRRRDGGDLRPLVHRLAAPRRAHGVGSSPGSVRRLIPGGFAERREPERTSEDRRGQDDPGAVVLLEWAVSPKRRSGVVRGRPVPARGRREAGPAEGLAGGVGVVAVAAVGTIGSGRAPAVGSAVNLGGRSWTGRPSACGPANGPGLPVVSSRTCACLTTARRGIHGQRPRGPTRGRCSPRTGSADRCSAPLDVGTACRSG